MLIGLTGRAGAGKDTVCRFMREWGKSRGVTVRREAFADRLKLSAARIFFPEIELEAAVDWCNGVKGRGTIWVSNSTDESDGITGREFLQRYGTEAHRDVFGQGFWVDAALQDLSADYTVVTDVRFPNEADAICARDGEVWLIERGGQVITESAHVSEAGISEDRVSIVIRNPESSFAYLRELVFGEMDLLHSDSLSLRQPGLSARAAA